MHTWSPDFAILSFTWALHTLLTDGGGGGLVLRLDDTDAERLPCVRSGAAERRGCEPSYLGLLRTAAGISFLLRPGRASLI